MSDGLQASGFDLPALCEREWLATNGIGGYASSTIASLNTRKYHGLLVAAMAPPIRRMVLLSRVEEVIIDQGKRHELACNEYPGAIHPQGHQFLQAFAAHPFPRWGYQCDGWTVEKQLQLLAGENTVVLSYTLLASARAVEMELRPMFAMRSIHEIMYQWNGRLLAERRAKQHFRIPATSRTPEIFFAQSGVFEFEPCWYLNTIYRRESERGYAGLEDVWSPGVMRFTLNPGQAVHFVCSSDPIELEKSVQKAKVQSAPVRPASESIARTHYDGPEARPLELLLRAASQFVIATPPDGTGDTLADSSVICIGHYPWGAPSARAALIGFGGLFLVPQRFAEARAALISLAAFAHLGLLPTGYPEDGAVPSYTGADVSLWFINAVWQYYRYTKDDTTIRRHLLDPILRILECYRHGTELGIGTDADGLLYTRSPGQPTTWMDGKIHDWVVTPRAGRPVEINALWYNAVCIASELCKRLGHPERGEELGTLARNINESFNQRFWHEQAHCCFDVVEDHGNDPAVRPNQLLAISLPFAVLSIDRHAKVLEKVRDALLTPVGIRTLSPHDPAYVGQSRGNVVERDRAHYNGSAHPWLLGPYITALFRVLGRSPAVRQTANELLEAPLEYLADAGLGQLCELFDGDMPHNPRGAPASAPAVGELLRCYAEDVMEMGPQPLPPIPNTVKDMPNMAVQPESYDADRIQNRGI